MSKIILITGASTGIGAATALELARGNTLFIHYNQSQEEAESVASEVRRRGGTAHLLKADLMTEAGCYDLARAVEADCERLDVLVNNAGGLLERHNVETMTWDLMERIFRLNTYSAMMMTRLCLPLLRKGNDPCIVNMTSVAPRTGAPTATIYGASKGALDSFTRGSARELAPEIRVNAIAPGIILTPFHERYSTPEFLDTALAKTPLGYHGESEHIAGCVAFLIENTFITGETIDINGGIFMR